MLYQPTTPAVAAFPPEPQSQIIFSVRATLQLAAAAFCSTVSSISPRLCFSASILVLALSSGQKAGGQEIPGVPAIESGKWIVRLVHFDRRGLDSGDCTFLFNAQDRASRGQMTLRLQNETTEIDRIEVSGDRLVIFGSAGTSADVVSIFDLRSGAQIDSFLCWWPHMSATGRYIAAVRFYPRFSDPTLTSDVVVLYDLQRSSRTPPIAENAETRLTPIYPEAEQRDRLVENESERHFVDPKAGFLWSSTDDRLAFIDRFRGDSRLALVKVPDGHATAWYSLDIASILDFPKSDPTYAKTLSGERAGLAIQGLHWDGQDVIIVELDRSRWSRPGLYRTGELRVSVAGWGAVYRGVVMRVEEDSPGPPFSDGDVQSQVLPGPGGATSLNELGEILLAPYNPDAELRAGRAPWQLDPDEPSLPVKLRARPKDIAGYWKGDAGESPDAVLKRNADGSYMFELESGGCLAHWKLSRQARYEGGALTLDFSAMEYPHERFQRLFVIELGGEEYLLPSMDVARYLSLLKGTGIDEVRTLAWHAGRWMKRQQGTE
jgi:hypothetical protein